MSTRHERSIPLIVRQAMTAAAEYGVAKAGLAIARRLDRDVIAQAHNPRGAAGRVTAWEMAHRPSNRQRSRWAVTLLGIQPGDQVLEIGFGPGLAIAYLVRAGAAHVDGVDHSAVMLQQASRRNAAAIRSGRVTLFQAPVDNLPPALAGPFTAILAVNSLAFWPAPVDQLADLRRRLTPAGRIAIVSQPRCPGATAATTARAAEEIGDLLSRAGFTPAGTQTLPLNPPVACVLATTSTPAPATPEALQG